MRMQNKNCVVTGGASGIGAAIVRSLVQEGANVSIFDINLDMAEGLADQLGAQVRAVHCDVSSEADVAAAAKDTFSEYGDLHVLVNNAARELNLGFSEATEAQWTEVFTVNAKGPWLMCKHFVPHMLERQSGSVVNVASATGLTGFPMSSVYGSSKGAAVMFTKHMAAELSSSGVRFNCVCPGVIHTPMIERWIDQMPVREEAIEMLTASMPIGRLGEPEEIASAVLYFASDESSLCQGSVLQVDGGFK